MEDASKTLVDEEQELAVTNTNSRSSSKLSSRCSWCHFLSKGDAQELCIASALPFAYEFLALVQLLIEQVVVSRLSAIDLAAHSISTSFFYTFLALWMGPCATAMAHLIAEFSEDSSRNAESPSRTRIGALLWQGVYISVAAALVAALFIPVLIAFYNRTLESSLAPRAIAYAIIMHAGSTLLMCLKATFSSFFSGRANFAIPLIINTTSMAVATILTVCWVLGYGIPSVGIAGAAWSLVITNALAVVAYVALIWTSKANRALFGLLQWRPDGTLLWRLLQDGFVPAAQQVVERAEGAAFAMVAALLGVPSVAACAIVLRIKQLLLAPLGALAQGVQATLIVRLYRASAAPAAVSAAAPSASSSEGQQRTDRSPFSHPSARGALNVLATGTTMGGLWCALAMIACGTVCGGARVDWGFHMLWLAASDLNAPATAELATILLRTAIPLIALESAVMVVAILLGKDTASRRLLRGIPQLMSGVHPPLRTALWQGLHSFRVSRSALREVFSLLILCLVWQRRSAAIFLWIVFIFPAFLLCNFHVYIAYSWLLMNIATAGAILIIGWRVARGRWLLVPLHGDRATTQHRGSTTQRRSGQPEIAVYYGPAYFAARGVHLGGGGVGSVGDENSGTETTEALLGDNNFDIDAPSLGTAAPDDGSLRAMELALPLLGIDEQDAPTSVPPKEQQQAIALQDLSTPTQLQPSSQPFVITEERE